MVSAPVMSSGSTGGWTTSGSQSGVKMQKRIQKNTEMNATAIQTAGSINATSNTAGRAVALQNQTGGNILGFTYE